ncbi:MAG: RNA-binding protein [Thaumarchaeota archaeon]|nr:MAG: RNA-binding protein [Candidatus Wolframiiraptor sp.]RLG07945.1 MAG: RNA-binding protein [Nitrososphaerota archaeon]HDD40302.1 RNA-binding protein [Nitrososphaeria archaeon]
MARSLVIVGKKDAMRYVTACITLFNRGEREVTLRARGRNIENCIRTIMLLRKSFYSNLRIKEITIGSDRVLREDGRPRYVSFLEAVITL